MRDCEIFLSTKRRFCVSYCLARELAIHNTLESSDHIRFIYQSFSVSVHCFVVEGTSISFQEAIDDGEVFERRIRFLCSSTNSQKYQSGRLISYSIKFQNYAPET